MSFWGKILDWAIIGASFAAKKNNPAYATIIDEEVKALKNKDFLTLEKKASEFIISEEEKKILEKLEKQRQERQERAKLYESYGYNSKHEFEIEDGIKEDENKDILKQSKFTKNKYITKSQIIEAPENVIITDGTYADIWADCNYEYKEGDRGYFAYAIMKDGRAILGGHSGQGGRKVGSTRNTGLHGQSAIDYGIDEDEIDYYFLVQVDRSMRTVTGRSNIKKVV